MKKLFFIFLLLTIFIVTLSAQDVQNDQTSTETVTEYVTDTDFEKLLDKYSNELSVHVSNFVEQLEGPALQGWEILKRQIIVETWTSVGGLFIMSLILFVWLYICYLSLKSRFIEDTYRTHKLTIFSLFDDEDSDYEIGHMILGVIFVIMFIITAVVFVSNTLPRLLNTDYYVIERLINIF